MDREEVLQLLKYSLSLEVKEESGFSTDIDSDSLYDTYVSVQLVLNGEVISEVSLP